MIPTLILFGIIFGRWPRVALAMGTIGWVGVLLIGDVMGWEWGLLTAAALALLNTLAGVLVHQALRNAVRSRR